MMENSAIERLKLLFDYTKFHIGLYAAVATVFSGAIVSKTGAFMAQPQLLLTSVVLICVAGFAGGVVASSLPHFASIEQFWDCKIGPFRSKCFRGETWTYIEHTAFWLAVIAALGSVHFRDTTFQWNWILGFCPISK